MKRLYQIVNSLFKGGPHITRKILAPFDLETPLCHFSSDPRDVFTIRHAAEGIQIFGASGSGKSSGSGRHLAIALLESGAGGLVLTVKPDEPRAWQHYCAAAGRLNDLVVFSPAHPWRFNFMEYQY